MSRLLEFFAQFLFAGWFRWSSVMAYRSPFRRRGTTVSWRFHWCNQFFFIRLVGLQQ